MKDYAPDKIRNVALVGHGSSGKTSLASALLFDFGATGRLTKVDKGNTITDYEPEEIDRKISINSAVCFFEAGSHRVNCIDTPGYSNFLWDAGAALRAVDGAAVLVDGVSGVEVGTEKVWEMLEEVQLPRLFVINKLDRENASFSRTLESIVQFFGRQAVPVQIPIGEEKDFSGVVDLIKQRAVTFERDESGKFREEDIPAGLKAEAAKRREALIEMIAENDEKLMEKYLDKGELGPEEVHTGLKKAVFNRQLFPVYACSALANIGAQTLAEGIIELLPSPLERGSIKATISGQPGTIKLSVDEPLVALVFKTLSDPYTGRISLLRVYSGKLNPDSVTSNVTKETDEKLGGLFFLQGKEQLPAGQAKCGDIVATAKLKVTSTGDTLAAKGTEVALPAIKFH